jgi:hypothetical protein
MTNYMASSLKLVIGGKTIETNASFLMLAKFSEFRGDRSGLPTDAEWEEIETALAVDFGIERAAKFVGQTRQALAEQHA